MASITSVSINDSYAYHHESVFISDDNIVVDSVQLPAYTITENNTKFEINQRLPCVLNNPLGMKRYYETRVDNKHLYKFDSKDVLWTYERIDTYNTITECKQFIEGYINEEVTQRILASQAERNQDS